MSSQPPFCLTTAILERKARGVYAVFSLKAALSPWSFGIAFMRPRAVFGIAIFAPLFLSACAGGGGLNATLASSGFPGFGPRVPVQTDGTAQIAAADQGRLLSLINGYRSEKGLGRLSIDPRLTRAARDMAMETAGAGTVRVRAHRSGSLRERMKDAGLGDVPAAENLLMGEDTVDQAFAAWKASRGHNRNLLKADVTHMGLARATRGGRNYWALIMAGPPFEPRPLVLETSVNSTGG